jgi:hypothetical protein
MDIMQQMGITWKREQIKGMSYKRKERVEKEMRDQEREDD